MKIKFLIIVVFLTISGNSQNKAPTYKDVVTLFYKEYDVVSIEQKNEILFEKRNTGWNIVAVNHISKDSIKHSFWDKNKMVYNRLYFPRNFNGFVDDDAIYDFLKSTTSDNFNNLLYYGYIGWDKDLIELYEGNASLTDLELFSLGYAYSNYASSHLNDNYPFSDAEVNMKLPITKNSMTDSQLQKYLLYQNKAIKAYSDLFKRNPKFETIPGAIGIKYHNEISSNFLSLRIYQNEEVALESIKSYDLYTDNFKLYAKNMLDSCEKNAILFTGGDNDTFPLLIYQVQNNYRRDVLIVNTSLLQDERYVLMMMNDVLDSKGIRLSINTELIKNKKSEVFIFSNTLKDTISIKNLNNIIHNESNVIETLRDVYKAIPTNCFNFSDKDSILSWTIDEQALYRSHLIMLDIIATNNWERPIYFADNNSFDYYLGLSKYLEFDGVMYKLTSKEEINSTERIGYINPFKVEQNLKALNYYKNKTNLPVEERQLIRDTRLVYARLANFYIENNELKKAEAVLNECVSLYPNGLSYFGFDIVEIIESYYKLESFEKAKQLEMQLLLNFDKGLDNYSYISTKERREEYTRLKRYLGLIKKNYNLK